MRREIGPRRGAAGPSRLISVRHFGPSDGAQSPPGREHAPGRRGSEAPILTPCTRAETMDPPPTRNPSQPRDSEPTGSGSGSGRVPRAAVRVLGRTRQTSPALNKKTSVRSLDRSFFKIKNQISSCLSPCFNFDCNPQLVIHAGTLQAFHKCRPDMCLRKEA